MIDGQYGWNTVVKTSSYRNADYGDVVLTEWPDGSISIARQVKGNIQTIFLSSETIREMDKIRDRLPPEVALATSKAGKKKK